MTENSRAIIQHAYEMYFLTNLGSHLRVQHERAEGSG